MGRLLLRTVLLALPFIVVAGFIAVVDPFDCFGFSHVVSDDIKINTALPLHNPLWKLQQFARAPVSRLILGDSSVAALDTDKIRKLTGQPIYNFAYGGGTLAEVIDTYWFASSKTHLDAVYVGIGLINFNEYQNLNRVPEAEAMLASPLKYLTNRIVLSASVLSVYSAVSGHTVKIGSPNVGREEFWQNQINESSAQLLHEYRYPEQIAEKLTAMAADCRKKGTKLVIIIPPTHLELQNKVLSLGRGPDDARFKSFVATLGTVYDFDYPNEFTSSRTNFSDPFHTVKDDTVIQEVWGNRGEYSRRSGAGN